jgi:hypothetical protein
MESLVRNSRNSRNSRESARVTENAAGVFVKPQTQITKTLPVVT